MLAVSKIVVATVCRLSRQIVSAGAALGFMTLGALPASAQFDLPDWDDVVPFVINPFGALTERVARPVFRFGGVDPELGTLITNPTWSFAKHAPEAITEAGMAELRRMRAEVEAVGEVLRGDRRGLARSASDWIRAQGDQVLNSGIEKALQPLMSPIVPWFLRDAFMDEPQLIAVNPWNCIGDPVYYVNGIDTSRQDAVDEAAALSAQLLRPVFLIHNSSSGTVRDVAEAAYDRAWPFLDSRFVQANATTRQVTYLLYHSEGRISIVSHSQGCLIVRNALLTANSFSGGTVKKYTAWVATGLPLRSEEVYPRCARFRSIASAEDPIAQSVGLRLGNESPFDQDLDSHSFRKSYVSDIRPLDVWPSSGVTFGNVSARHNVFVPNGTGGFANGMQITTDLQADYLDAKDCVVVAYFAFSNGVRLQDFNGQFRAFDGQVSVGTELRPRFEFTSLTGLTLSLPYQELHLGRGQHELKFQVMAYVKRTGQFVGTSQEVGFTFTL